MKNRSLLLIFFLLLTSFFSTAQLTGEWTSDEGVIYRIRQIDNRIFWSMENLPRVRNVFIGYIAGNVITGVWAELPGGNMQGTGTLALRVESANRMVKTDQTGDYQGSVWTRGINQTTVTTSPSNRPDLSGTWYDYSAVSGNSGAVSKITQQVDKLVFINSFNDQADGYFIDNTTVIATKWQGGLKATLEDGGRRIVWKNGSVWERSLRNQPQPSKPDLSGTWYDYSAVSGYAGVVSNITQQGEKLVFINSFNDRSDGYFIDNTTVIATKWQGGLKATLEDGGRRIVWTNGSVWQRSKK
jgi:hypothetical protein